MTERRDFNSLLLFGLRVILCSLNVITCLVLLLNYSSNALSDPRYYFTAGSEWLLTITGAFFFLTFSYELSKTNWSFSVNHDNYTPIIWNL